MILVPALFTSANVLEIAAPEREWLKCQQAKIFCGNSYVEELCPSCLGGANFNGWEGLALPGPPCSYPCSSVSFLKTWLCVVLPVALLVSLPKAVLSRSLNVVSFFLAQKPCFAHNIFLFVSSSRYIHCVYCLFRLCNVFCWHNLVEPEWHWISVIVLMCC